MINGAPLNVKDFGAVGDGVADDTAAIQAAIDVFRLVPAPTPTVADTGGGIYFPRGIYRVSGLEIKPVASINNGPYNGITLFGENAILKGTPACTRIIKIDTFGDMTKNVGDININGLQFDLSDMTTPGANGSVGLWIENVFASTFSNLSFFGGPPDNTHLYLARTGSSMSFSDIHCSRIVINGQDFGPAQLVLTTCQFYSVRCTGIRINAAWDIGFYGCIVENPFVVGAGECAFQLTDCRHITIIGGDYEGSSPTNKYIDASVPGTYGVSNVYSVNNTVASLTTYAVGEMAYSYFQDRFDKSVAVTGAYPAESVTTVAKTIYAFPNDIQVGGNVTTFAKIGVTGNNGGVVFYDEVVVCFGGYVAPVVSSNVSGVPAARTYTFANGTDLQLTMASGTYLVETVALARPN
jgi:hypothetical protein